MFKGISDLNQESKNDGFFDLFREDMEVKKSNRMEEELFSCEHQEFVVFSMPFGQREDILGESRPFGLS